MYRKAKVAIAIATLSVGVFLWLLLNYVGNEEEYKVHYDESWGESKLNDVMTTAGLLMTWEEMG
jgi:hypothetical protein